MSLEGSDQHWTASSGDLTGEDPLSKNGYKLEVEVVIILKYNILSDIMGHILVFSLKHAPVDDYVKYSCLLELLCVLC
jgi:hypothetical protein